MSYIWNVRFVLFSWFFTQVEVYVEYDGYKENDLSFYFLPWRSPTFVSGYIKRYVEQKRNKLNHKYEREASYRYLSS